MAWSGVPSYLVEHWYALFVPSGVPAPVLIVVGEMTGVPQGLGALLVDGRSLARTDLVIARMLVIGAAGRDNIAFGPRERDIARPHVDTVAERFTRMVGLQKFAGYFPAQLSGGMKQRVAIARVLANDCELMLMDEPFGALDALTRERLQAELLDIWQQPRVSVLFVTHSVEEAVLRADRVLVMSAGPGRIAEDVRIDLPRPHDMSSPAFNDMRRALTGRLTIHIAPGMARDKVPPCTCARGHLPAGVPRGVQLSGEFSPPRGEPACLRD